jgi:precorrin-4/cobalt-precorrin-4 C11-methyltransferase
VRVSWPDERLIRGTLATIAAQVAAEQVERTAVILVGRALDPAEFRESALYSAGYDRRFRPAGRKGT